MGVQSPNSFFFFGWQNFSRPVLWLTDFFDSVCLNHTTMEATGKLLVVLSTWMSRVPEVRING